MNWETYTAFGDSITIGARTYLSYPDLTGNLLQKHLNKNWDVINIAVSGYKAIDLSRYIDQNALYLKSKQISFSTLLIGTNDVKENTSLEDFKVAFSQVLFKIRQLTCNNNVIVCKIPSFPKGVMYPYTFEMNELLDSFNVFIQEESENQGVRCLSFLNDETDFYDGIHLNIKGNENFSNQLASFVLKDKGILIG
jgi:lysophospholipase L1-like esterase